MNAASSLEPRETILVTQSTSTLDADAPVHHFAGVEAAKEALVALDPGLVIADLDLFDGSGLEILAAVDEKNRTRPAQWTSIVLFADRSPRLERLSLRTNHWVRERTPDLEELIASTRDDRTPPATLLDYCMLALAGLRPVLLDVWQGATRRGSVRIRSNHVWNAEDASGPGRDALTALAALEDALITCEPLPEKLVVQPIPVSLEKTLTRALRPVRAPSNPSQEAFTQVSGPRSQRNPLKIATPQTLQGLPAVRPVVPGDPPPPAPKESFEELLERAVDMILLKRYPDAVALLRLAEVLRPNHPMVTTNLARLRSLGHG